MKRLSIIFIISAIVFFNAYSICLAQKSDSSNSHLWAKAPSIENKETQFFIVALKTPKQMQGEEESLDDEDFLEFDEEMEEEEIGVADPLYYWNKGMYHFNDKLYFWLLKPVARGYRWAVPETPRRGVSNFFHNLWFPIRFVGCLLQAKGSEAASECGRFLVNSTVGVLGFGNPAKKYPALNPNEEDVGQAFGRWGIGNGFYIVWPVFGPSTVRDSVGLVGNYFLNPITYVDPAALSMGIKAYDKVNKTSFRIGDYEAVKKASIDPYVAIRNGYLQLREKKINE